MGKRGVKKIHEVTSKPGRPKPPAYLDTEAKKAWESLCDDLEAQGTLVETDRKIVELYATSYSLMSRAYKELLTQPMVIESAGGGRANPLCTQYRDLSSKVHRILLDCGLSPTTRKTKPDNSSSLFKDFEGI